MKSVTVHGRFSKLPESFVQDYEIMLVVMTIIAHEIRSGIGLNGNCHAVARALGKFFPNFEVIDGYIPVVSPSTFSEQEGGVKSVLIVTGVNEPQPVRFKRLYHSWLAWKGSDNLIIDPWAVGGGYGFSPPIVRFQDGLDIPYIKASFPDMMDINKTDEDARSIFLRLAKVFESLQPELTKMNNKKAA